MENNTRKPIELLTDMLATMTERAMKAEKERDEANARSLEWYRKWEQREKDYKEMQGILSAEIEEHQRTKSNLEEAVHAVDVLNDELCRMRKTEPAVTTQRSAKNSAICRETV